MRYHSAIAAKNGTLAPDKQIVSDRCWTERGCDTASRNKFKKDSTLKTNCSSDGCTHFIHSGACEPPEGITHPYFCAACINAAGDGAAADMSDAAGGAGDSH